MNTSDDGPRRPVCVVAMGGNSLLDPTLPPTVPNQAAVTARAMVQVADLIEQGERLVITHGNGPQVGWLAYRAELSSKTLHDVPLDSLVADTQGSLGYMIQRALRNELYGRGLKNRVATLVTEVVVNPDDHAFEEPTKPIGHFHTEEEAIALTAERGWRMVEDSGRGWRRVVPSPAPVKIVELDIIRDMIEVGIIPICCGGGGVPVVVENDRIHGVEGVVDKDRVSALLGVRLGADTLVLTTGVDGIYLDFQTDRRRRLDRATTSELAALVAQGQFPAGSMGPKVKACLRFLQHGGKRAVICRPDQLPEAFAGRAGTQIVSG